MTTINPRKPLDMNETYAALSIEEEDDGGLIITGKMLKMGKMRGLIFDIAWREDY